jgi:hypothetical protein
VARISLALAGAVFLTGFAVGPLSAGGAPVTATGPIKPKKGEYKGNTSQERVVKSARTIVLKVSGKKNKISLTQEPAVARNQCIAAPVFLLDVDRVTTKLGKGGKFKFTRTFIGSKIDRISGRFVSQDTIEGEALYNFRESDSGLCGAGSTKVKFDATSKKKKKKKE